MTSARLRLFACSLLVAGCQAEPKEVGQARPVEKSPNASILPAPLASDIEARTEGLDAGSAPLDGGTDAGAIVPVATREDRELGRDSELKDTSGLALKARWRWLDVTLPSRLPEANTEAVERARSTLQFDLGLELASAGRMRMWLDADSFLLPRGSELRASVELLGHALVWPDKSRYTVLPAGALRAVLNERRRDVVPLTHSKPAPLAAGQVLGLVTERRQLVTPLGKIEIDQTRLPGTGSAGLLLCRMLLELGGVDPENSACAPELLPLRAEFTWLEGARSAFEVSRWSRVAVIEPENLAVPPAEAGFAPGELPSPGAPLLVAGPELAHFRVRPVTRTERSDKRETPVVKEGLLVVNRGELSAYVLVDGVPVLRAGPRAEDTNLALLPGTYSVAARDFLGTVDVAPSMTSVPARVVLSEAADSHP